MTVRQRLLHQVVALAAALLAAVAAVPFTATPARAAAPICLSGAFQYDYQSAEDGTAKPTRTKPVRNANLELWGAEGNDDPHYLGVWGYSGRDDGSYNLCYTPTKTTSLSVVWVQAWAESSRLWRVLDGENQYVTMESMPRLAVTASTNLGTMKAEASTARAWHAFDTVNLLWWSRNNPKSACWSALEPDSGKCTELTIRAYESDHDQSQYSPGSNTVYLVGAGADSEHLILHEAGHFFLHRLYNGMWPAVDNCSPHYIQWTSSATCAWTEGFADVTAAYLLGDNRFVHGTGDSTEFTYGSGWDVGDQVQGNVGGSLLDLWRTTDGGWNRSIDALTARRPGTFSAYFNTARPAANPPLPTDSTALGKLARHAIDYGPSIVGDGTYHSLSDGGGLALEVYGSCVAGSGANVTLGTFDTTRAWQRWRVDANADGTVRISDACTQPLTLTAPAAVGGAVTAKAFDPASAYQKWTVTKGNGTLRFTNPQTGRVLDSSRIAVGAPLTTTAPGSANSQSWVPLA
ncbi:hypothetical protein GCM10018790_69640 [Kitasatospora xanthocidica]|uniref:RICIN domain-containing protein n=1 Tax=Kitasatospora xanthocidica TaxID=83382 RepID=UPI001678ACB5|nr:ricin-type beta-trefoil lectin domain protein [Kitasatospora xanthocidica]GHF82007.1 hypothetical protein GCM10018790_69640 [Kitasatospora xanthocidica]